MAVGKGEGSAADDMTAVAADDALVVGAMVGHDDDAYSLGAIVGKILG